MLYSLLVSSTTVLSYGWFGTFVFGEIDLYLAETGNHIKLHVQ